MLDSGIAIPLNRWLQLRMYIVSLWHDALNDKKIGVRKSTESTEIQIDIVGRAIHKNYDILNANNRYVILCACKLKDICNIWKIYKKK